MDFSYSGNGVIYAGGIAPWNTEVYIISKYEIGETVYSKPKALDGVLRKHTIKEIRGFPFANDPNGSRMCKFCNFPPMYIDTFNAYHNEEDLVTLAEAQVLIVEHEALEELLREQLLRE